MVHSSFRHSSRTALLASAALAAFAGLAVAQHPAPGGATPQRIAPPALAARLGLLPLQSTGVLAFRKAHPTYDGRGVLIGILDSGIDPSIPGLQTTTTGLPKILDLRDFSGEGRVALTAWTDRGDVATVGGTALTGLAHVRELADGGKVWTGVIRELVLGEMPAADLNGDGDDDDSLAVAVIGTSSGWALFADTNGDGSLADESPVHDYLVARETFGWSSRGRPRPLTLAANFAGTTAPELDLFFDNSSHGSHVAGIAAGHDIYETAGLDGVAPGAQLLGLKIANDAQGGLTTTGSMERALDYAIRFAADKQLPLVLNMSFGVGNEQEGRARIDAIIDSVLAAHPDVVFAISAGNDGPGLSTIGFPGSASRAIGVGATFPIVFRPDASGLGATQEPMASFSSRGGELSKPDISVPGVAYSTVPNWNTGDEIKGGTSMASPHAAGLAALLESAAKLEGIAVTAMQVRQSLVASATAIPGAGILDAGAGRPNVNRAFEWLEARLAFEPVRVTVPGHPGATAVLRRDGVGADTTQTFVLQQASTAARTLALTSDQPWLVTPASTSFDGGTASVTLALRASMLTAPGVYTGVVTGTDPDPRTGPIARLIVTIAVPLAPNGTSAEVPLTVAVNTPSRLMVPVHAGRPAIVQVRVDGEPKGTTIALHEPDGMPYRGDHGAPLAAYDSSAFSIDGLDAVTGDYELVVLGGDPAESHEAVRVIESPVIAIGAHATAAATTVTLQNATAAPVRAVPALALLGVERHMQASGTGGAEVQVPLAVPAWATKVVVDMTMDRAAWSRFTDFGATLFGPDGRQLGKEALNYPFGRLEVALPPNHGAVAASLGFFPGFADAPGGAWSLDLSVRYEAADPVPLARTPSVPVTIAASASANATFAPARAKWTAPEGWRWWAEARMKVGGRTFTTQLPIDATPAAAAAGPRPRKRTGRE